MSTTKQIVTAAAVGLLIVVIGSVSSLGKFVLSPGFGIALTLGGSFDEPGYFSERSSVTLIYIASFVVWALVAFAVQRTLAKRAAA